MTMQYNFYQQSSLNHFPVFSEHIIFKAYKNNKVITHLDDVESLDYYDKSFTVKATYANLTGKVVSHSICSLGNNSVFKDNHEMALRITLLLEKFKHHTLDQINNLVVFNYETNIFNE